MLYTHHLLSRLWHRFVNMMPFSLLPKKAFGLDTQDLLKGLQPDYPLANLGLLKGSARSDILPGLGNWDNSCYQNSVIQGLASLPHFNVFLHQVAHNTEATSEVTTIGALRETLLKLNDSSRRGQTLWTPPKLKSMSSWQQQDAQEYFSKIMEQMEKDVASMWKEPVQAKGLEVIRILEEEAQEGHSPKGSDGTASEMKNTKDNLQAAEAEAVCAPVRPPRPQDPLGGFLGQRVACMTCGFTEGLSLIPFNCITVPLGGREMYGLQECLDEYTKLETIDDVECSKCTLLRTQQALKKLHSAASARCGESGSPSSLQESARVRLGIVEAALEDDDFSDNTLTKRCQISKQNRVSSAKSRQAVIAKAPSNLVIHVNRSVFDEFTGAQRKNYAQVNFPKDLDLDPWCLGRSTPNGLEMDDKNRESWSLHPRQSMLPSRAPGSTSTNAQYELRAVVTHYGRHENGHYICYRKHASSSTSGEQGHQDSISKEQAEEAWWRLSDEDVSPVSEDHVLQQGGVFMLFYERRPRTTPTVHPIPENGTVEIPEPQELQLTEAVTKDDQKESNPPDLHLVADSPGPLEAESAEPATAKPALDMEEAEDPRQDHVRDAPSLDEQAVDHESITTTSASEDEAGPLVETESDHSAPPSSHVSLPQPPQMRTSRMGESQRRDGSFSSSQLPMVAAT